MIHVGVDLHQRFCYMTAVDSRGRLLGAGQVRNQDQALRSYFAQFRGPVQAAVEACSFWPAFRKAVCARVQVRLVHPQRVKAIASAKLKNDRIDSATLVRQRTRLKNQVHAILHQQGLQFEGSDLFGQGGRAWLKQVSLPAAGGSAVKVYLKLIDEFTAQISTQDEELKRQWKKDARVLWLETIPGIGWYSAVLLVAEIGDILRFQDKRALANYAGLVPWLRESADKRHSGGITRVGSPWLRWIMVEAAHVAVRTSPPVKKWFERLCRRKHKNAALVAVWAMLHDGVGFEEKHFALN